MDYFKRVERLTPTRFWINNVTRSQASRAVEAGARCCTQNPSYLSKVMYSAEDGPYILEMMDELIGTYADDNAVVGELQRRVIAQICERFMPVYAATGGREGLVSIQADPFHEDADTILENAEKCIKLAENFIIKIPATCAGLKAMAELVKRRTPVLATEVMSIDQAISVYNMYQDASAGINNPAPFWFAHINGIFDEHLTETVKKENICIEPDILRQASFILARKMIAYKKAGGFENCHYVAGGARGVHHFTEMVGVDGAVTINWSGTADRLLEEDPPVVDIFSAPASPAFIDELCAKIPDFRRAYIPGSLKPEEYESFGPVVRFRTQFEEGWKAALKAVVERRAVLKG